MRHLSPWFTYTESNLLLHDRHDAQGRDTSDWRFGCSSVSRERNNQRTADWMISKKHVWDMSGRTYLRPKTARSQNTAPTYGTAIEHRSGCSWAEFQMRVVGTIVEGVWSRRVIVCQLEPTRARLLRCADFAKVCKRTALSTFLRRESICKQQIVPNLGGERCALRKGPGMQPCMKNLLW